MEKLRNILTLVHPCPLEISCNIFREGHSISNKYREALDKLFQSISGF